MQLAYPCPSLWPYPVVAFSLAAAMQVGTGGAPTAAYYLQRGEKGYAFANYSQQPSAYGQQSSADDLAKIRTPSEALAHIRATLKPAVTDLADAMKVSRQAVYDWQNGKPIAAENASRLADLARAADVFADAGITTSAQLLRRPIISGKTLFAIAHEGGSLESAAQTLVRVMQRELGQRKKLAIRLKGRTRPEMTGDDYSAPALDEMA
jgi:transcriptional regulator with XRE-family HTH domain